MSEETRRALLATVAFVLLCLSFLLLFFRSASAAWQVEKEFPPGFYSPASEAAAEESEPSEPDGSQPMEEETAPEPEESLDSGESDTEIPPYFGELPEDGAVPDTGELSGPDDGPALEEKAELRESPEDLTLGASSLPPPPGYSTPIGPGGLSGDAQAALLEDIRAIRTDISLFLYGFLPLVIAVLILYKFCIWFYRTFIASAF